MAVVAPIEAAPSGRRRLSLSNPATLERLGEVELQTSADVSQAVERARKAQPDWSELGFGERVEEPLLFEAPPQNLWGLKPAVEPP